jgi:hypothetical protein
LFKPNFICKTINPKPSKKKMLLWTSQHYKPDAFD